MRRSIRLLLASTATACLLVAVPGGVWGQSAGGGHGYTTAAIQEGARVYRTNCTLCHGPAGDGVDGVDLRVGRFRSPLSDEGIRRVVGSGAGNGRMPAFDLAPAELEGVVAYIRAGFDPSGIAVRVGDAAQGRTIFENQGKCLSCHRVNGRGARTGPDLSMIGAERTPATLQRALVDPDAALRPIDRPVRIVTRDGEMVRGRRLNEDTYTVQLIDSRERLRSFRKSELVTYEVSDTAVMQPTTLSDDQVADLVGYLLSLRGRS